MHEEPLAECVEVHSHLKEGLANILLELREKLNSLTSTHQRIVEGFQNQITKLAKVEEEVEEHDKRLDKIDKLFIVILVTGLGMLAGMFKIASGWGEIYTKLGYIERAVKVEVKQNVSLK